MGCRGLCPHWGNVLELNLNKSVIEEVLFATFNWLSGPKLPVMCIFRFLTVFLLVGFLGWLFICGFFFFGWDFFVCVCVRGLFVCFLSVFFVVLGVVFLGFFWLVGFLVGWSVLFWFFVCFYFFFGFFFSFFSWKRSILLEA